MREVSVVGRSSRGSHIVRRLLKTAVSQVCVIRVRYPASITALLEVCHTSPPAKFLIRNVDPKTLDPNSSIILLYAIKDNFTQPCTLRLRALLREVHTSWVASLGSPTQQRCGSNLLTSLMPVRQRSSWIYHFLTGPSTEEEPREYKNIDRKRRVSVACSVKAHFATTCWV